MEKQGALKKITQAYDKISEVLEDVSYFDEDPVIYDIYFDCIKCCMILLRVKCEKIGIKDIDKLYLFEHLTKESMINKLVQCQNILNKLILRIRSELQILPIKNKKGKISFKLGLGGSKKFYDWVTCKLYMECQYDPAPWDDFINKLSEYISKRLTTINSYSYSPIIKSHWFGELKRR